ncbi:hypothetical protein INQ30_26490, partial [Escherichia coli]|nr:hypothetical protein [Escherichia coli]
MEASQLTYAAAEVIGHAAVSELLNSAEPPAGEEPEQPTVHPVTGALREKLAEAFPGVTATVHTRRPFTDEDTPAVTV